MAFFKKIIALILIAVLSSNSLAYAQASPRSFNLSAKIHTASEDLATAIHLSKTLHIVQIGLRSADDTDQQASATITVAKIKISNETIKERLERYSVIFLGSAGRLGLTGLVYWAVLKYFQFADSGMFALMRSLLPLFTLIVAVLADEDTFDKQKLLTSLFIGFGIFFYACAGTSSKAGSMGAVCASLLLLLIVYLGDAVQSVYAKKSKRLYGVHHSRLTSLGFFFAATSAVIGQTLFYWPGTLAGLTTALVTPLLTMNMLFLVFTLREISKHSIHNQSVHALNPLIVNMSLAFVPLLSVGFTFLIDWASLIQNLALPNLTRLSVFGLLMAVTANLVYLIRINHKSYALHEKPTVSAYLNLVWYVLIRSVGVLIGMGLVRSGNWSIFQIYFSVMVLAMLTSLVMEPYHHWKDRWKERKRSLKTIAGIKPKIAPTNLTPALESISVERWILQIVFKNPSPLNNPMLFRFGPPVPLNLKLTHSESLPAADLLVYQAS